MNAIEIQCGDGVAHDGEDVGQLAVVLVVEVEMLHLLEPHEHAHEDNRQHEGEEEHHREDKKPGAHGRQAHNRHPQGEKDAVGGHHQWRHHCRYEGGYAL